MTYICLFIVPAYFLFVALYVFLFGVSLGPEKTNTWLAVSTIYLFYTIHVHAYIFILVEKYSLYIHYIYTCLLYTYI